MNYACTAQQNLDNNGDCGGGWSVVIAPTAGIAEKPVNGNDARLDVEAGALLPFNTWVHTKGLHKVILADGVQWHSLIVENYQPHYRPRWSAPASDTAEESLSFLFPFLLSHSLTGGASLGTGAILPG